MKRGKGLSLLLAAVVSFMGSCANEHSRTPSRNGHDLESSWSPKDRYQQMLDAKYFAFGGVGFAGTTSASELGFRQVLDSPDAAKRFRDAYPDATIEGRLYVLCGLRVTDRNTFDHYVASLRTETNHVMTMSGCIANEEPLTAAVQRIVDGYYDSYFTRTIPANALNESDLQIRN